MLKLDTTKGKCMKAWSKIDVRMFAVELVYLTLTVAT